VLARQNGPTILVGHSWGGTVISEAGVDAKVVGLVYVSALSPEAGETTAEQYTRFKTPPEFIIDTQADGCGFVNADKFKAGFTADTSECRCRLHGVRRGDAAKMPSGSAPRSPR
jgi:pimeloyl-ACP methyl ester carboxylesterase